MGIQSSRLKAVLDALGQPPGVATLLSVGFHTVLFATGPSFSSLNMDALGRGESSSAQARRVPLIELSPDEQAKLPAFTRPEPISPDGLDTGNDLGSLGQDLQGRLGASDPDALNSPDRFSGPSSSPLQVFSPPPFRSPVLPPIARRSPVRRAPTPESPTPETSTPETPSLPPTPTPEAATPTPEVTPTDSYDGPTAADLLPSPEADSVPLAAADPDAGDRENSGEDPASEAPAAAETEAVPDALIARQQATTYSPTGTTEAAADAAQQEWLSRLQAQTGDESLDIAEVVELPLVYERRICLDPEPQNAQVGLWLAANPEVQEPLVLLKSSGYPFINRNALEMVAATVADLELSEPTEDAIYLFDIEVAGAEEGCVSPEEFLNQISEPPAPTAGPESPDSETGSSEAESSGPASSSSNDTEAAAEAAQSP